MLLGLSMGRVEFIQDDGRGCELGAKEGNLMGEVE